MNTTAAHLHAADDLGELEVRPFGPQSMIWDDFGDTLSLSLIGGAFVLQVMHPTIGAAVDRQSVFRTDPWGRAVRSVDSMMLWVYGGEAAVEEGQRLRELHKTIRGVGRDGAPYSALNPEAYAWVHGTAFATGVKAYPYFRGREMTDSEQRAYYEEVLQLGDILQVPRRLMPPDPEAYWDYYHEMVATRLRATDVAVELLRMLAAPALPLVPRRLAPLAWPARRALGQLLWLTTVGTMSEDARELLGVRWSALHEAQLRTLVGVARPVHRRLPETLRYAPLALHARRHAREVDAARRRATVAVT